MAGFAPFDPRDPFGAGSIDAFFNRLSSDLRRIDGSGFGIANNVTDPETGLQYFKAVDEGRSEAVAGQGPLAKSPARRTLTFSEEGGAGEQVFPKSVGPSAPARISDRMLELNPDAFHTAFLEVINDNGGVVTSPVIQEALEKAKEAVKESSRQAAIEQTRFQETRRTDPTKRDAPGLEDSFVAVDI